MASSLKREERVTTFLASTGQEATAIPPAFVRRMAERPKVPHNHFTDAIPVLSLAALDSGDDATRTSRLRDIATALEQWGAFQVVDHGVDPALISAMLDLSARFFALPPEDKLRFEMTAGGRGGFVHSNRIFGETVENWRECVSFFSYPVESRDYALWPEMPEGWRKVSERYCSASMELTQRIMEVLSELMGLKKSAVMEACLQQDQKVKVNLFPRCPQPELTLGLGKQTESGTITLVLQDQVGGLQLTRDGGRTWLTVKPVLGAFVVTLGDYVHYLSNGRFAAPEQQVVVNSVSSRMSIYAIHYPSQKASVWPLKLGKDEKPLIRRPITFQEMYLEKRANQLKRTVDGLKNASDQENGEI